MDLGEFSHILLASLNPATQKASEESLKRAEQANLPEYVRGLATLLCDPSRDPNALRVAGVLLKNQFYDSRSDAGLKRKYHIWNNMVPEPIRQYVRECVLRALVSPVEDARKSAAQIVAALGVLELSEQRWPEMITTLFTNATNAEMPDAIKVHTLEAMGYLCESLDSSLVSEAITNNLLTAIVENMKATKSPIIRLAAVTALNNTLAFASANMRRENERNYIVSNICECARADRADIRYAAFDCMTTLANMYYALLSVPYMDAFFHLTVAVVKAAGSLSQRDPSFEETEKVALHALEFWCTLCEQEIEMAYEADHARGAGYGLDAERVSKKFIQKAMGPLIELITSNCLIKQAEILADDEDDWNIAMSGGTLLGLIARCEPDSILSIIMPFVQKNLPLMGKEHWRQREAGLMAFGKSLEGPPSDAVAPFIREGLEFFLSLLDPAKESVPQVRDTAAWVIGVVCDFHLETIKEVLPRIVAALVSVLSDPAPVVAGKGAVAIQNLAVQFSEDSEEPTNQLTQFLPVLLPRLLETTARPDWEEGDLRGHCFESINAVVESCAPDGFTIVASLLEAVIGKLTVALQAPITTISARDEVQGMIGNCCGTMLVIIQRLRSRVRPHAETIMMLLVQIMSNLHNGVILMDVHLVVGAIATALGMGFMPFYPAVMPYIVRGIENSEDYQTCQTATELVSDLARAINKSMAAEIPMLIQLMLKNLANEELHMSVKPTTFSALADVALAVGINFQPFAEQVLSMTDMASGLSVKKDDPDMVDYLNEMREAVLECYTAVILALRPNSYAVFARRIDGVLHFIATVCREATYPESDVTEIVLKNAVGLLGDVCLLAPEVKQKVQSAYQQAFQQAVEMCRNSDDEDSKAIGNLCLKSIST